MKKRLILTISLMLIAVVAVFAQPTDSDLIATLAGFGISKGLASVIVTLLVFVIGHFAIPQKWTSVLAIVQKVLEALVVALSWINGKTNKLTTKQKEALDIEVMERKRIGAKRILKVLIIGVFISSIGLSASAQNKFSGMLQPVKLERVNTLLSDNDKAVTTGVFVPRYKVSLASTVFKFNEDTEKIESSPLSRVGAGFSWSHYIVLNNIPYNDYSFDALILFPTDGTTNLGAALTFSALDFYGMSLNAGVMYDFIKGKSFKHNIGLLTGITLRYEY